MSGDAPIGWAHTGDEAGDRRDLPAARTGGIAVERRREPRTPTNWIALIRLLDGTEISCNVKDVSKSGARLGVPDTVALPETFLLKVLGYDFLVLCRLVWRGGNAAGVRIERFTKQKEPGPKPEEPEAPAEPPETYIKLGTRRSRFSPF